jgi:hypothetical protein
MKCWVLRSALCRKSEQGFLHLIEVACILDRGNSNRSDDTSGFVRAAAHIVAADAKPRINLAAAALAQAPCAQVK